MLVLREVELNITNRSIEYVHEYDTISDVIHRLIHVYCSIISNRTNWLSKREVEFYTALVLSQSHGLKYDDEESDYVFEAVFGKIPVRRRKDYVKKISDKGWIRFDEDNNLLLPEVFNSIDLDSKDYSININLLWD